jgi:CASC3/Barentsz eIF4AIII binding
MASDANEAGEKTEEYESDPEDSLLPAMRRREAASDDEEESDGGEDLPSKKNEPMTSRNARSDGESDGQGGAEVYDDDDVDDYDEDEEEYDELGVEYEHDLEEENGNNVVAGRRQGELEGENTEGNIEEKRDEENKEGEKKENEPYAVPTSGAFYMHDDRFQENGRGGRRRYINIYFSFKLLLSFFLVVILGMRIASNLVFAKTCKVGLTILIQENSLFMISPTIELQA